MGFMDSMKDFAGKIGESVEKGAKTVSDGSKKIADKSKIKREISRLEKEINDSYIEIGKKYFEKISSSALNVTLVPFFELLPTSLTGASGIPL